MRAYYQAKAELASLWPQGEPLLAPPACAIGRQIEAKSMKQKSIAENRPQAAPELPKFQPLIFRKWLITNEH
jgi:hypothetical protein